MADESIATPKPASKSFGSSSAEPAAAIPTGAATTVPTQSAITNPEVHPAERAEGGEQENPGRGQHNPQHIEYAPGPRDGHSERSHELQRDGDAERNTVDGLVERKVHQREREPEEPRDEVGVPVAAAQLRAHQNEQRERSERYPQEHRTAGTQGVEEVLGYSRPELDGAYGEHHERRGWHAPQTVREARGDGTTVGHRNRNLSARDRARIV